MTVGELLGEESHMGVMFRCAQTVYLYKQDFDLKKNKNKRNLTYIFWDVNSKFIVKNQKEAQNFKVS